LGIRTSVQAKSSPPYPAWRANSNRISVRFQLRSGIQSETCLCSILLQKSPTMNLPLELRLQAQPEVAQAALHLQKVSTPSQMLFEQPRSTTFDACSAL